MLPGLAGSIFQCHMYTAAQTADKLQNRFRFRLQSGFHNQLAGRIQNRRGDRRLVHIQPNNLASFIRVLLSVGPR